MASKNLYALLRDSVTDMQLLVSLFILFYCYYYYGE